MGTYAVAEGDRDTDKRGLRYCESGGNTTEWRGRRSAVELPHATASLDSDTQSTLTYDTIELSCTYISKIHEYNLKIDCSWSASGTAIRECGGGRHARLNVTCTPGTLQTGV